MSIAVICNSGVQNSWPRNWSAWGHITLLEAW